jgi:hypothetical protein
MRVKRTKSGKYSFEVSNIERDSILFAICNFGEDESVKLNRLPMMKEAEVMRHLYYNILESLLKRLNFHLQSAASVKWVLTRTEAITLMWFLRNYDHDMQLLELKSGLHKSLQA